MNRTLLEQVQELDVATRLELIGFLWSSIEADTVPLSPAETALIDERLAEADASPLTGRTWESIKRSLSQTSS